MLKKYSCLVKEIYALKSLQLYKVGVIVFLLFNIIYTADAVGYTPTLRFSTDGTTPLVHDPNLKVQEGFMAIQPTLVLLL